MKNIMRKLAFMLVFAMVLEVFAPGFTDYAYADDSESTRVIFSDAGVPILMVEESGTTYAMSLAKEAASASKKTVAIGTKNYKLSTVSEWTDGHDYMLYFLKPNKDNDIAYSTDGGITWAGVLTLPKQDNAPTVKYQKDQKISDSLGNAAIGSADMGYIYFEYASGSATVTSTGAGIETRISKDYGWMDATATDLLEYADNGATLEFRVKAKDNQWPSKAAKLSIKKKANAPKVTIDPSKMTITIPKNAEYRLTNTTVDADKGWVAVDAGLKKESLTKLLVATASGDSVTTAEVGDSILSANNYTLQVRIAAKDDGRKFTAPSKITKLQIKNWAALTAGSEVKIASEGSVVSVNLQNATNETAGITITNHSTTSAIEYYLDTSSSAITSDTKWKAVKAASTTKDTEAKIKGKKIYVDDSGKIKDPYYLFIRKQGDAKSSTTVVTLAGVNYIFDLTTLGNYTTKTSIKSATANKETLAVSGSATGTLTEVNGVNTSVVEYTYTVSPSSVSGQAITDATLTFETQDSGITKATDIKLTKVSGGEKVGIGNGVKAAGTVKATKSDASGKIEIPVYIAEDAGAGSTLGVYTFTFANLQVKLTIKVAAAS